MELQQSQEQADRTIKEVKAKIEQPKLTKEQIIQQQIRNVYIQTMQKI